MLQTAGRVGEGHAAYLLVWQDPVTLHGGVWGTDSIGSLPVHLSGLICSLKESAVFETMQVLPTFAGRP